ncbi:two-component system VirA-like sensor kinase [Bradyrhizobium iriomotense]|uniref:histidine kinase n=1 Tax=Bradyrhizobium iriomotense TaxID=441950 RepID=A0ABQ6B863_9BRAD|nr:two-component system VirA-like sensor kinase [Bradyrhizobium iriomotense]GLR89125.1 two-component sensor histidine kinase [Bradyrhizobium iriomotense]
MRMTPVVVFVSFLLLLLIWLLLSGLNFNSTRFDQQIEALDHFSRLERALNREVLTARTGLSRNYDELARLTDAYDNSIHQLREAAGSDTEEESAIAVLAAGAQRQQNLVEQFKSRNALLRNSFLYFGMFSTRLAASDRTPVVAAATMLSAAMLHLTLDTSPAAAREVKDRLEQLARLPDPGADAASIQEAIAHGGVLHDLLPATDAALKALIAAATTREQDAVRALIMKRQIAARASALRYRVLLYATSVLLLGALIYLGLQLRARAIALRRRAAFEHVIAGVSMRFINAQPNSIDAGIARALADMAECIGCDRAYFVSSEAVLRQHIWSTSGMSSPPDWPQRAMALMARFEPSPDGIIHVPRVNRLPIGESKEACVALGLGGWACATSVTKGGVTVALGFGAIGRACRVTAAGELSLLRMALDTIVYALERHSMESQRARLETRLQQARRMETVGTFSSGIAHNFNNILGGILGHAEMAEEHLDPNARSRRNLDAIRRGAERAQDLVDQILTFGRRREGRREPVCVNALVAEAKSLLAPSLPAHIEISVDETPATAVVSAEPAQLLQVILNICNNAAQAMDKPGVIQIQIGKRKMTDTAASDRTGINPGHFVVVSISDPGRGMDEVTLERIFEPFFTTRPNGNGFGLATARDVVLEHNGKLEVQSAPGVGTRFDIWLPSVPCLVPISSQRESGSAGRGMGETVLVLETDRERLLRHEEILAALGYEAVGFTRPQEAVQACAARGRFDAALVCQQAGSSVAIDFATKLRELAPNLPIMLATSSTRDLEAPLLAASGISEVVHHPLTSADLAGALSRCLVNSAGTRLQSQAVHDDIRWIQA